MKIGFYFYDWKLAFSDYSRPDLGNPGIGGTQFCFLLLMYHLRMARPGWQLTVYHYTDSKFPDGLLTVKIQDFEQCLYRSEERGDEFLVMAQYTDRRIWKAIENSSQRIIFWGHNFYYYDLCKWIVETPQVVANVFVGKQLYDCYADDRIIQKSTYIFNMISDPVGDIVRHNDSKTVVYMGALIPAKGFLILARMWKSIIQEVPDARLKVLGSGKLYNLGKTMGPLGVADEDFERAFLPYLVDQDGKLLKSVEFLGIVNKEKYDIFLNASVGVVNPSGKTETFGMGIVEMALAELPCVTLRKFGHIDTVKNNETGYLCRSPQEIRDKIVYLLKHPVQNEKLGKEAKRFVRCFFPENILSQWIDLFEQLHEGVTSFEYKRVYDSYWMNLKYLIMFNRFLRVSCRLSFLPSIIRYECFLQGIIKKFIK